MATSPVVQVHDVCASDPNFAVIFAFCERFGNLCGVDIPTFQELQEMLEKTNEVPSALIDLHVKLLRKVKKSVHADKWERAIIKFCQTYSIPESWEVESYGYKGISTQLKLKILKNLLEAQFDSNVKFKAEINKLESSALRSQPLGWDKQGVAYWAQFDRSCNLRVYKEDIEEDTWNIVARDRSTLVNLINKLSGTNDKLLDEEVEDSNSIESMSEIVAELSPGLDQEKDESSSPISEKNGAVDFNVNNLENKTPNEFNVQTTNFQRKLNDESAQNYTANENLNDPIVGETVEESVMIIKGEGTGQECETGNPGENEPHEENNKADEVKKPKLWSIETICSSSKEVREEIIPVPKTGFFFGDDSVPCIPNIENENDASDKTEIKTLKETVDLNEKNESHDTNFDNLGTSNTLLNTDSDVVLDKVEDMPSKLIPKQSVFNITIHEKEIQITEQNSNEAFRNAEKCDVNTNYEISETDSLQRLSNDSERIKESTERESKIECNQPTEINIKIDNQLTDQNCSNANNTNIIDKVHSDQSNLQNTTKNIAVDISSQSTSSNNKTIEDKKILDIFILDNDKKLIDTVEQGKKIDIRKSKNIDGIIESSNVVSIIDESKTEENNQKIKNYIECVKVDNLIKPTDKIDSCDKTDISNLSKSNLNTNDQFIETKKELENISDQSYETVENKLHHYNKNLRADKEKTRSAKYEKIINCNAIETNKPLSFRHSDNEKSSSNNKCNKEANSEIKNEISELDYNNKHTIDNLLSNHDDNSQNTDNNYSLSSKLDKIYAERNQKTSEIKLVGQKSPIMNVCDKLEFSTDELEVENKNSSKDPIFDIVDKNSEITSLGNNNNNKKGKSKNDSSSAAQQEKDKPCSTVMWESNDKIKKIKVIEKEDSDETINEESTNFSKHKEDINLSVDCKNETDIEDSSIITTEKNDTATIPERMSMPEMPLKMGEQFEEKSHKTKEFNNIENPKKRKERKKELEDNTESVSVLTSSLEEEECHSVVNKFEDSDKHEKDIEKIDNKFNDDEQQADDNEEYEQKSEEDEELPKKITKPVGRKKRKRGKAKKIIVKKVNKDNEEEKVKKPRKPRQKKAIPLVEEIEIKPEENENQDNIRRSRRIAEIKIKEQVLPPDIYDNDEDSKSSMKKEKGRKKNIQIKKVANLIQSDDDDDEEESTINKKSKKKRKKGKTHNLKGLNKKNPWNVDSGSSSSDNNAEEFEDYYHEEEDEIPRPGIEPNISDHEFSPESDINEDDEEYLPEKRARTAHKKSQGEQIIDDMPCQNCNKSDHPDWILLCDTCNQGWHGSCLRPALMVIPDGDWYCPPCRHESLLNSLKATLKKFDSEAKKRENEELRRKRLAYVGISLQNVISTKIEDTKSKQHKNDATSEEEEDYDGEESEASDSNDSEPLYKLRARRQTNVSYRFNDYDDMINEAILEETGNEVTDVSKTYLQTKIAENENSDSENEFSKPEGSPIAPALLHLSRRRKSKKLTNLDISSDDDSDDDFKGPSEEEDEDEEEGSEYSDDSVRKRPQPTRRSVRSRRTVVDPDFINDDTSDESDIKKKKKRTREWSESEDSEEEDVTWGKRAKKRANVSSTFKLSKVSKRKRKANDNSKVPGRSKIQYGLESDSESDGKTLRKTRRKQITYAESDDSEEEIKPKRSKALSDDEDEYVLNDEELETEKDDINEDVDDIEDEELPNNDDDKEETSTTPVQRIPTPVKSPQQSVVPVQKAVTDELPLPDTSCDPPQRDIIGNQTTPNQRILPTQLVTADLVDNKKETVSSHSQKSPTAIDYSAYPYSPEKVAIPPPTLTYPVPPRLPVQGFVNKQVSSPVLPAPYTGYRNKTPINSPAPYGPIPQGQQVYHAPGSFSYPVEYGTTAALHHQQRPLPQGFEPALRNAVLPPTNEVLRGNDENPSSEFGGLVSYFSSQQEDDFDA